MQKEKVGKNVVEMKFKPGVIMRRVRGVKGSNNDKMLIREIKERKDDVKNVWK